jgi:hypothetical protein
MVSYSGLEGYGKRRERERERETEKERDSERKRDSESKREGEAIETTDLARSNGANEVNGSLLGTNRHTGRRTALRAV